MKRLVCIALFSDQGEVASLTEEDGCWQRQTGDDTFVRTDEASQDVYDGWAAQGWLAFAQHEGRTYTNVRLIAGLEARQPTRRPDAGCMCAACRCDRMNGVSLWGDGRSADCIMGSS